MLIKSKFYHFLLALFPFLWALGCSSQQLRSSAHAKDSSVIHFDLSWLKPYRFELEKLNHLNRPYTAVYKKNGKTLIYLASDHLSGRQFSDLKQHPTFMTISKVIEDEHPDVIVLEGLQTGQELSPKSMFDFADRCAKNGFKEPCGETGYGIYQARVNGIEFTTGEPLPAYILARMKGFGYTDQDLLSFYLLRQIPYLKKQGLTVQYVFPNEANRYFLSVQQSLGISNEFGFKQFEEWYSTHMSKQKIPTAFDMNDTAPDDGPKSTFVQKLSHKLNLIRDESIVTTIEQMLNQFNKVMVVYGGSHLLIQETVFEKALGPAEFKKFF